MKTARFATKLVDDREKTFGTQIGVTKLLSPKNLLVVNDHVQQGTGEYPDIFPDDMALAHTTVTFNVDNAGRPFYEVDVSVVKFTGEDRDLILNLLHREYAAKLAEKNGEELRNPLPEVKL